MELKNFLRFVDTLSIRHDPNDKAHAANTVTLVKGLAEAIEYPIAKMPDLLLACHLHDIGKLSVDNAILRRVIKLTVEEIAQIHRHPIIGFELVSLLGLDPIIPQIVLEHHERFDGTGYPHGLRGESICLEARIISICDTFDALTTDRAYRKALIIEDAVDIMKNDTGCYDPALLDIFIRKVLRL
jgi:HD-GYP domain-containing protein (c-di-GMP phosphodiesterase class II)